MARQTSVVAAHFSLFCYKDFNVQAWYGCMPIEMVTVKLSSV